MVWLSPAAALTDCSQPADSVFAGAPTAKIYARGVIGAGRNVIEIYVEGERVRRMAYTR